MSQFLSTIREQFHWRPVNMFSLRKKVVLLQLPLALVTAMSCGLLWLVDPAHLAGDPLFRTGAASVAAITVLSWSVPWGELKHRYIHLVIPLLDLVAVALLAAGSYRVIGGLAFFLVFPIFWLAWSGFMPRTTLALGLVVPVGTAWLQVWHSGQELTMVNLLRPMMIPVVIAAFALTTVIIEAENASGHRELGAALDSSRHQTTLLDAVLNAVSVGVIVVDDQGHDVMMNDLQRQQHRSGIPAGNPDPTEAQMLLFGPDHAGRPLAEPLAADQRPVRRAILRQEYTNQLFWAGAPGRQRPYNASARSLRDEHGNHAGAVVVINDVDDVVNALQAKDAFLSSVSHELRTPLTSIIGYLELVADDPGLPPCAAKHLSVAAGNSHRLLRLVNDLLTAASAYHDVRFQEVDLVDVVRASTDSARPSATTAGIDLRTRFPATVQAMADPLRIAQIVDNLISNALKYSTAGGQVTVGLEQCPQYVILSVCDTGQGMSPEEVEQLFTRFYRTDSARRAAIPGAGLGLSITRELVAAHQGTIEVASEQGRGSTFTVKLPLHADMLLERAMNPGNPAEAPQSLS